MYVAFFSLGCSFQKIPLSMEDKMVARAFGAHYELWVRHPQVSHMLCFSGVLCVICHISTF